MMIRKCSYSNRRRLLVIWVIQWTNGFKWLNIHLQLRSHRQKLRRFYWYTKTLHVMNWKEMQRHERMEMWIDQKFGSVYDRHMLLLLFSPKTDNKAPPHAQQLTTTNILYSIYKNKIIFSLFLSQKSMWNNG